MMIIKSSKIILKYFQRKVKVAIKHTKQSKQNDILDWNAMFVYEMFNLAQPYPRFHASRDTMLEFTERSILLILS